MDNLTHSLVGLLASRAGLERYAPSHPALLFVLAANAPDLDVAVGLTPELYLVYHRHLTHSVFAIPFMAAAAVWLAWGVAWCLTRICGGPFRRDRFGPAWAAASLVAATHPLLDWMNSYGLRPWLPFSDRWAYGDLLFVIDLVVWAILLAGAGWSSRPRWRVTGASTAFAVLAAYIGASWLMHDRAIAALRDLEIHGGRPHHVTAWPGPVGPLDWAGYAEAGDKRWWLPLRIGRLDEIDAADAIEIESPPRGAVARTVWQTPLGRAYRSFVRVPFIRVDERTVRIADLRFYRAGRVGFACLFRLDEDGAVIDSRFEF